MAAHPRRARLVAAHVPDALFDGDAPGAALRALVTAGFDHAAASWVLDAAVACALGHLLVEQRDDRLDSAAAFETGLRLLLTGLGAELGI